MKLEQVQKQNLSLSVRTLHSIKILQMNSQELVSYIHEEYNENPCIELQSPFRSADIASESVRIGDSMASVTAAHPGTGSWNRDGEDKNLWENIAAPSSQTLAASLEEQLSFFALDQTVHSACIYLIECLDERGYIDEEFLGFSSECPYSFDTLAEALEIIQSLEPAGVGARSLEECLAIQLNRRSEKDPVALQIVHDHLEALGKRRYSYIAQKLHQPEKRIKAACETILSLDPIPGNAYAPRHQTEYIIPDIYIEKNELGFEIQYNDSYIPSVHINSYYQDLRSQSKTDDELHTYLTEKLNHANWIISCINQRKNALLQCASLIVKKQYEFFVHGPGHLAPLRLSDLAEDLGGIHVSTVSRIIKGKYLHCSFGTFPFSYFFINKVSSDTADLSSDSAKRLIKEMIDSEDKIHPLSDQAISDALAKQGLQIARRTVAKYREAMEIPSAQARKNT